MMIWRTTRSATEWGSAPEGERRGAEPNDEWDDPDERDLAPDEMAMVRCTNCRKWIIEETVRCPYCKMMQLEGPHHGKPFWFVIALALAILGTLSWFVFAQPGWLHL